MCSTSSDAHPRFSDYAVIMRQGSSFVIEGRPSRVGLPTGVRSSFNTNKNDHTALQPQYTENTGGRTRTHSVGASGGRTSGNYDGCNRGCSESRAASQYGSGQTSHGGSQGGRTSEAWRDPHLSGIGFGPQQKRTQSIGDRSSTVQEAQGRSRRSGW
jgi:hypothetical protein